MTATPFNRILISRTDSIGDVVLTLPLCGWIKKHVPSSYILFLGKKYTRPVVDVCIHIDEFVDWDELSAGSPSGQIARLQALRADVILHVFPQKHIVWLAKRAGIAWRVATGHRFYTIPKCNKLVFYSRKKSDLHEAQLNMMLLKPLGLPYRVSLEEIGSLYGLTRIAPLSAEMSAYIHPNKTNLILHPKSKGSAVEWGLPHFAELISLLPVESYNIFITGTQAEGELIRNEIALEALPVTDLCGRMDLHELIRFIAACDALVAASTGPLHLAAALGKKAVGLYPGRRPMHPGRWGPIGKNAVVLVAEPSTTPTAVLAIEPRAVADLLLSATAEKKN